VYVELLGERQATLVLAQSAAANETSVRRASALQRTAAQRPRPLPARLTEQMEAAHRAFVETLGTNAIWRRFYPQPATETDKAS
jgi:DNA polymerase-3 subunit epsilon